MRQLLSIPVFFFGHVLCLVPALAQDVDLCPPGWEETARAYLAASMEGDYEKAASYVKESERQAWLGLHVWRQAKSNRSMAAMEPDALARMEQEKARKRERLDVSQCLCEKRKGEDGAYRVRVDPDGRSFSMLNLHHSDGAGWRVETRHTPLDGEQMRMATAFLQALDDLKWEEAEAWVAEESMPRFQGYRAEVEAFLKGGALISESRERRAALRAQEWNEAMLWARADQDGVVVVQAEFPTATKVSCEMRELDGAWRILMR